MIPRLSTDCLEGVRGSHTPMVKSSLPIVQHINSRLWGRLGERKHVSPYQCRAFSTSTGFLILIQLTGTLLTEVRDSRNLTYRLRFNRMPPYHIGRMGLVEDKEDFYP